LVYPKLISARATLELCYCADNGRVALEPVLMLGVSLLQSVESLSNNPLEVPLQSVIASKRTAGRDKDLAVLFIQGQFLKWDK
jgi:hypothetical protein